MTDETEPALWPTAHQAIMAGQSPAIPGPAPTAEIAQPSGLPQVLREYGQAFRGDWSSTAIDGRSVRDEMDEVAGWIERPETYPGDEQARVTFGICPAGHGHWLWLYCDDECVVLPPATTAGGGPNA